MTFKYLYFVCFSTRSIYSTADSRCNHAVAAAGFSDDCIMCSPSRCTQVGPYIFWPLVRSSLIRQNRYCVCVGDAYSTLLLRILYSFFLLSSSYFTSQRNLGVISRLWIQAQSNWNSDRKSDWSLFRQTDLRKKYTSSNSDTALEHCSEAVCTLLLRPASAVTAVACSAACSTKPADIW